MSYRPKIKSNSSGTLTDLALDAETLSGHSVETVGVSSNTTTLPTTAQVKSYVDGKSYVIDITNGVTAAIKSAVTTNPAIILKHGNYYYVPQTKSANSTIPTIYECFAGNEGIYKYITIDWTNLTISTSSSEVLVQNSVFDANASINGSVYANNFGNYGNNNQKLSFSHSANNDVTILYNYNNESAIGDDCSITLARISEQGSHYGSAYVNACSGNGFGIGSQPHSSSSSNPDTAFTIDIEGNTWFRAQSSNSGATKNLYLGNEYPDYIDIQNYYNNFIQLGQNSINIGIGGDDMFIVNSSGVDVCNLPIQNVGSPTQSTDAATKEYVDEQVSSNSRKKLLSTRCIPTRQSSIFKSKTWTGLTSFDGSNVWTDGDDIYYSSGTTHYVLDIPTSTWKSKTWTGLTNFNGKSVWSDGDKIYYYNGSNIYYLANKTTWTQVTKTGYNKDGQYIWTDGIDLYYSYNGTNQVLNKTNQTWSSKTWSGAFSLLNGSKMWTDGTNIYESNGTNHRVLDINTSTWTIKHWKTTSGTFDPSFNGEDVWTDGDDIYINSSYVVNVSSSTLKSANFGISTTITGSKVWTDGDNVYYSNGSTQYILNSASKGTVTKDEIKTQWVLGSNQSVIFYEKGTYEVIVPENNTINRVRVQAYTWDYEEEEWTIDSRSLYNYSIISYTGNDVRIVTMGRSNTTAIGTGSVSTMDLATTDSKHQFIIETDSLPTDTLVLVRKIA